MNHRSAILVGAVGSSLGLLFAAGTVLLLNLMDDLSSSYNGRSGPYGTLFLLYLMGFVGVLLLRHEKAPRGAAGFAFGAVGVAGPAFVAFHEGPYDLYLVPAFLLVVAAFIAVLGE
ncbi:MAG TPA: hypothetical protein VNZ52_15760 [Candidatus Thermoplasmatota archaeon]|nr:hypothetical protein [Candidatus Thermoplasmatota archaeon]